MRTTALIPIVFLQRATLAVARGRTVAALALASAFVTPVCAQAFMRPSDNAAALALGGAAAAYPDPGIGLVNEAQAARVAGPALWSGLALPYALPEWRAAHLQAALPLGRGGGAGIEFAHAGAAGYGEQCLRLVYARRLAEQVYLGAGLEALRVYAGEYGSAAGATVALGVLARARPGLWLGARLHNPVSARLAGEPLPASLRLGLCWQASPGFQALAETEKRLGQAPQFKAGLEYSPLPALSLRLGARNAPGRIALGAGLRLRNNLHIDIASEWHPALGVTPAARLRLEREKGRK